MKKRTLLHAAMSLAVLAGGFAVPKAAPAAPVGQPAAISVTLDGNALSLKKPPILVNSRLLVPVRAVSEALGAEVSYDAATKTVNVSQGTNTYLLPIGSQTVMLNGVEVTVDAPAALMDGTAYVPLRFVAEHLGVAVEYDSQTRTVQLTSSMNPGVKVLAPAQGETLYTDQVSVAVAVFHHQLTDFRTHAQPTAGEGHVHIWLDSDTNDPNLAYKLINGEPVVFDKIPPGEHTLTVQLVGNDHKPIKPAVKQVIRFATKAAPPAAAKPATPKPPANPGQPPTKPPAQVRAKTYAVTIKDFAF